MRIESVELVGFRNFANAKISFAEKTLIIGANDVGKTNLLHALRILLDRTLSETEIEPKETDFHIGADGKQADEVIIVIKLIDVTEDAVISKLKGHVSDKGETVLCYMAKRDSLTYQLYAGHAPEAAEEIEGRFYLKHIHFRYVESCRDIEQYINREKRFLLKIAKNKRTEEQKAADDATETQIQSALGDVNEGVNKLTSIHVHLCASVVHLV